MRAALVTGGSKRIGAAICRALAAEGTAVAIHCNRSVDEAVSLAAELEAAGSQAAVVEADLSDPSQVTSLVERAAADIGPLDLLVNNASLFEYDDLASLDPERYLRHQAINALAPLLLSREFASQAPESGAAVVNILDQKLSNPNPDYLSYTASKQALGGLTSALAQQLAPNVRVNGVAPGLTLPSAHASAEAFAEVHGSNPLARGVRPEDIAEAVIYLARAAAITGVVLHVDGGEHLAPRSDDVLYGKG
ncbi:MAG: short chain dehydrogenase [Candidatus Poseidoniales archaeon]|jgi:NAD(P)-dependent dehydrogenase (short-subunit alcohol dehydrogenase family)|nr:MAG: short chain dehydrogenase [Euryarchaeota archaeon]RUA04566.1 MAG: short chain dehydrogenase [Candidatus Poseidoniales archaeon]